MTAILVIAFLGGFHGGRDVALSQLRSCWEEGGIQANRGTRGACHGSLEVMRPSTGTLCRHGSHWLLRGYQ